MLSKKSLSAVTTGVVALLAIVLFAVARIARTANRSGALPEKFAGAEACASCHAAEMTAWQSSQHAVAMQNATPGTVLGRFDGARFTSDGVTSTFFRRGNRYFVNTDGEDGALHDFEIRRTFGVYPLQQYLVELSRGRVQVLTIAWDARPAEQGGQHWFSLTPGHSQPQDPLHWTGRRYNWNYTCADCHSTALRKGYDGHSNQYRTTFAELNVGCEGCHGPGSRHVKWGRYPAPLRKILWADDGLKARLTERRAVHWSADSQSGIVRRSTPRPTDHEIDVCAQCHARRVHVADGYEAGAQLFDYYIPVIIADMYYPDGQQKGEVYNYGSFLQSRMYAAGVTCSDCHDPHTAKLRMPGNNVCTQCHAAAKYDTGQHHHHIIAGTTGTCTSCHMPTTTYMDVDPRHDHSMRIPRPDLSVKLGLPNACNSCHSGKEASWAAAQIEAWYPNPRRGFQQFAEAFAADDRGDPGAIASLARIATDSTEAWFVRASALGRLAAQPSPIALRAARAQARDSRPLIRLAALQIAEGFGATERLELAAPMLSDSTRVVRQGAAWLLAPIAESLRSMRDRRAFEAAAAEFVASQRYNSDQPSSRLVLGAFFLQRNQLDSAEAEFRAALQLQPQMAEAERGLEAVRSARAEPSRSPR
jgi:predicted CXXCH cytochrome family protein